MGRLLQMFEEAGLTVHDLRWSLPTHPDKTWNYRKFDNIQGIVIHHTAGSLDDYTAENLAKFHIRLGWVGIGYTMLVHPNGEIDFCHRLRDWGPHAGSINDVSFGICAAGNYAVKEPSEVMMEALVVLVDVLQEFFKSFVSEGLWVKPHRAVSSTRCPGLVWEAYQSF